VRCIQRNVKAFLAVRDWPWWRLLVRVTPLLNVHRTEEQLKTANEELIMLRAKLEKIECDRSEVKAENQKLEAKVSPKIPMDVCPNGYAIKTAPLDMTSHLRDHVCVGSACISGAPKENECLLNIFRLYCTSGGVLHRETDSVARKISIYIWSLIVYITK